MAPLRRLILQTFIPKTLFARAAARRAAYNTKIHREAQ